MNKKYDDNEVLIRSAVKEDMQEVAEMIQELADFEKMPHAPKLSVKELEQDGYERCPPAFQCKIAEVRTTDVTRIVGFALYFPIYSTWEGRAMMLEDLYVRTTERRRGVGAKLFDAVAKEAVSAGCSRLEFHVLEWNPACTFYEKRGAVNLTRAEHWCYYRLGGDELHSLARGVQ